MLIIASIAHGVRVSHHGNFQPREFVFVVQIQSDMNAGEIAALGIRKATGLSEEVILPALFHGSFFWMAGSLAGVFVENSKIPPGGIRLKKWREMGFHPNETPASSRSASAEKNRPRSCDARAAGFSGNLTLFLRGWSGRLRGVPQGLGTVSSSHS